MLRIYNSLTGKKEEFKSLEPNVIKMYACGITVSGQAHIGHAVQAMVFDIVRKYFEKKGYKVLYARNYTDVDDKIIAKANELHIDAMDFARNNIQDIDFQMERMKVDKATMMLKATDHIGRIIEFIQKILDKGFAYVTKNGDVYFSVEKDKEYGKLSHRNLEDAISGVRIETEEGKINPLDFALWKSAKPNEISWESPWGNGRPGWHIECSAMNYFNLGEQIDIHGGGRDLIFPHHENEIAQTECVTGKQFAQFWVHNGLVKVNGQKMSKSLGNSIFLKDLLDQYDNEIIRFALLQTNYKKDLNITDNLFSDAQKHLINFYSILQKVDALNVKTEKLNEQIDKDFDEAMDDDFNIAVAISNLFGYFKTINSKLAENDLSAVEDCNAIRKTYAILGLFKHLPQEFLEENSHEEEETAELKIPEEVVKLARERLDAKVQKNYGKADEIRNEISKLGFVVVDKKDGFDIKKI